MGKYSFRQYKIDTLLKMAKLTSDEIKREKFIAEARTELYELSEQNGIQVADSIEGFYNECLYQAGNTVKTSRKEIYSAYEQYCKNYSLIPTTRNAVYKYLREMGVPEKNGTNSDSNRYFIIGLEGYTDGM